MNNKKSLKLNSERIYKDLINATIDKLLNPLKIRTWVSEFLLKNVQ